MADTKEEKVSTNDLQKQAEQQNLEARARAGARDAQEELGWKGGKTEKVADNSEKERLEAEQKAAEEQKAAAQKAAQQQSQQQK